MSSKLKQFFTKLYINKGAREYHSARGEKLPFRYTLFTADKSRNERCVIKKKGR